MRNCCELRTSDRAGPRVAAAPALIRGNHSGFAEHRRAMLASLRQHDSLRGWRARDKDDLGVMLLEMWAYVCDVLSFYDETIAHECYVGSARLRPSLRKLVGLLGHRPRPAVAAMADLAVLAEGAGLANPASVHCADRIVATRSCSGLLCDKAVSASGYSLRSPATIFRARFFRLSNDSLTLGAVRVSRPTAHSLFLLSVRGG